MTLGVGSSSRPENPQQIDASSSTRVEIGVANMCPSQVENQPQASFAPVQRNQKTQMSWWRQVISSIVNFLKKLFHISQPTHSTQSGNVQAECLRDEHGFILKEFKPESIDLSPYKQDVLNYVAGEQKNAANQAIGGSVQLQKDFGRCQYLIAGQKVKDLSKLQSFLQGGMENQEQAQIVEALITQSSANGLIIAGKRNPMAGGETNSDSSSLSFNILKNTKEEAGDIVVDVISSKQAMMLQDIQIGETYNYRRSFQATYQAQFTVAPNAQLTDEGYTGVSMSGTFSTSAVS